jgi:hypothetical protein
MGQEVFVLMSLEGNSRSGKEWRPVAVVTDPAVAEQWQQYGKNVDWVPLELDEIAHIAPGEKDPDFRPTPKESPIAQRAIQTAKRLEETNARLLNIIAELQKRLGLKEEKRVKERSQPAVKASKV